MYFFVFLTKVDKLQDFIHGLFDFIFEAYYHYHMSKNLLFETESALSELRHLRTQINRYYNKNLSRYENSFLISSFSRKKGKHYNYLKQKGVQGKKYLGTDSHPAVNSIKEQKYFQELLQAVNHDIDLLESIQNEYVLPDYNVINSRLPKVYKNPVLKGLRPISRDAEEWKKRKEAEKAKYQPYRPEDLKHMAADGTMMRSLSEVIIANYLLSLGITFVYELPLEHHGKIIRPDFTILSPVDNRTEIIIEHQGAMDNEQYRTKYINTLMFYLQTPLVPNKDVFFTFNHMNRNLDTRQIDSILHIAFGIV